MQENGGFPGALIRQVCTQRPSGQAPNAPYIDGKWGGGNVSGRKKIYWCLCRLIMFWHLWEEEITQWSVEAGGQCKLHGHIHKSDRMANVHYYAGFTFF